jgi:hypothetical protein
MIGLLVLVLPFTQFFLIFAAPSKCILTNERKKKKKQEQKRKKTKENGCKK